MASYVTYWSGDYIKKILNNKIQKQLKVIYGSPHTVMPSLKKIKLGDVIYPVNITKDGFFIMAKLKVNGIMAADEYHMQEFGLPIYTNIKNSHIENYAFHFAPQTCCAEQAVYGDGTDIQYREFPKDKIPILMFGDKGKEKPPRIKDGRMSTISFSGFVRRISDNCVEEFEKLFNSSIGF